MWTPCEGRSHAPGTFTAVQSRVILAADSGLAPLALHQTHVSTHHRCALGHRTHSEPRCSARGASPAGAALSARHYCRLRTTHAAVRVAASTCGMAGRTCNDSARQTRMDSPCNTQTKKHQSGWQSLIAGTPRKTLKSKPQISPGVARALQMYGPMQQQPTR